MKKRSWLAVGWLVFLTACNPPIWNALQQRAASQSTAGKKTILAEGPSAAWSDYWIPEAEVPAQIRFLPKDSSLDIVAAKGLTLWYRKPFHGDLTIRYEVCAVKGTDSLDRCSDLNCFWMATDPRFPDDIFSRMAFRGGVFGKSYSLSLYYLGFGGNSNTTTRFRKYDGDYDAFVQGKTRPAILKEYTDSAHLIRPDHWYSVTISLHDGQVGFVMDGDTLVSYHDASPLRFGWFGLRTTQNHLQVKRFVVTTP